ncbi:MAG TPA: hypothetical protein VKI65_00410 [Gemmataceae bacterium]|nr:hypothetical protein [Gemmataceae bacterium]
MRDRNGWQHMVARLWNWVRAPFGTRRPLRPRRGHSPSAKAKKLRTYIYDAGANNRIKELTGNGVNGLEKNLYLGAEHTRPPRDVAS